MKLVLEWKLRRIAAGMRQHDVAADVGISTTRYSKIERGELVPSDAEREIIERCLPPLQYEAEAEHREHM